MPDDWKPGDDLELSGTACLTYRTGEILEISEDGIMGVSFCLYRPKSSRRKKSEPPLPKVDADFAITEYPRFLAKLAQDAGLGELWSSYTRPSQDLVSRIVADSLDSSDAGGCDVGKDLAVLKEEIAEAKARFEAMLEQEPLVEFLLAPWDYGEFDQDSCRRIEPRLRACVEPWERAPAGAVGWREKALALADAMHFVSQHRQVVLAFT